MKIYSGIGSRKTPIDILNLMKEIAVALDSEGFRLRSGGAQGADTAFESGSTNVETWRPNDATVDAIAMASNHHPAWPRCKPYVRLLHGRNANIILGEDLKSPSDFVVCWTPRGKLVGGTAMGIRIAVDNDITVYNLANRKDMLEVKKICKL